jgi:hypothetical protein
MFFSSRNRRGTLGDHVLEIQKKKMAADAAKKRCSARLLPRDTDHDHIMIFVIRSWSDHDLDHQILLKKRHLVINMVISWSQIMIRSSRRQVFVTSDRWKEVVFRGPPCIFIFFETRPYLFCCTLFKSLCPKAFSFGLRYHQQGIRGHALCGATSAQRILGCQSQPIAPVCSRATWTVRIQVWRSRGIHVFICSFVCLFIHILLIGTDVGGVDGFGTLTMKVQVRTAPVVRDLGHAWAAVRDVCPGQRRQAWGEDTSEAKALLRLW